MTRADDRYYLVPRRLVHATIASLILIVVVLGAGAYVLADRWLPEVERVLDQEASLASPDVVVVGSFGRARAVDQAVGELYRSGSVRNVVLLGRPFSPDDLAPAERSRRYGNLIADGIPPDRIVELYAHMELWDQLDDLVTATRDHGWRRVLILGTPGGSRRVLLGARSMLGPLGAEVGLRLYAGDDDDLEPLWWTDGQLRGHVLYNWILLLFGRLVGRY